MTNTQTISFQVKGMTEAKLFSVPSEWDDREIVAKMIKAYDNFSITEEGTSVIIEEHDKSAKVIYYTEPSKIDKETNPYATNPDWFILLTHTPANYLEELDIQPVTGENTVDAHATHIVHLTDEEVNMPLDEYRLSIVKTIGNYHITRRFNVGTPEECDLCDESFCQRWYFEMEFGDLNENGFIGYHIDIVDDTKPYEYPDSEGTFLTVEEAEAFIRSVQE